MFIYHRSWINRLPILAYVLTFQTFDRVVTRYVTIYFYIWPLLKQPQLFRKRLTKTRFMQQSIDYWGFMSPVRHLLLLLLLLLLITTITPFLHNTAWPIGHFPKFDIDNDDAGLRLCQNRGHIYKSLPNFSKRCRPTFPRYLTLHNSADKTCIITIILACLVTLIWYGSPECDHIQLFDSLTNNIFVQVLMTKWTVYEHCRRRPLATEEDEVVRWLAYV